MNVKRTVESFANAGAAGVMIEDQQWPKRKTFIALFASFANLIRLWTYQG
jgi:2-methylisocitrate lyase-like PEP mutase family enzyme